MDYGHLLIGLTFVIWYLYTSTRHKSESKYTSYPTFVLIAIVLTYYLPYLIQDNLENRFKVIIEIFIFYIFFLIIHSLLFRKKIAKIAHTRPRNLSKIYLLTIIIWAYSLTSGLDNPLLIIDRALNPRDYTHIRTSEGVITYLSIGFTFFSTFISACEYLKNKTLRNLITLSIFIAINILGGGKSSMVSIAVIFLFAKEIVSSKIVTKDFMKYSVLAITLLILSFGIFSRAGSRTNDVTEMITRFTEYQQEMIFSALLYQQANLNSAEYLLDGVFDTFTAGIPRALYPTKPQGSLYVKYVNPELQISEDINHFATYGIQLEGKLVFGWIWPVISATLLVLYLKIPNLICGSVNVPTILRLWNCLVIFGLIRAGLLFTTPWMIFIITPLLYFLLGRKKYLNRQLLRPLQKNPLPLNPQKPYV